MENEEVELDEIIMSLVLSCLRESKVFRKYDITLNFEARLDEHGNLEARNFSAKSLDGIVTPVGVINEDIH